MVRAIFVVAFVCVASLVASRTGAQRRDPVALLFESVGPSEACGDRAAWIDAGRGLVDVASDERTAEWVLLVRFEAEASLHAAVKLFHRGALVGERRFDDYPLDCAVLRDATLLAAATVLDTIPQTAANDTGALAVATVPSSPEEPGERSSEPAAAPSVLRAVLSFGPRVDLGLLPGVSLGAGARAGVVFGAVEGGLRFRAAYSRGDTTAFGVFRGFVVAPGVDVCVRSAWLSACVLVDVARVAFLPANDAPLLVERSRWVVVPGLSVRARWEANELVGFGAFAEASVATERTSYVAFGERLFRSGFASASFGLELDIRFDVATIP